MGKYVNDAVLDAALDKIATADQLVICEDAPTTYAEATTDKGSDGVALGEIAVDAGDFTKSDGDASGRKVTVAQQASIPVDVSGAWDHVALVDDADLLLLLVTMLANSDITAVDQTGDVFTIEAVFVLRRLLAGQGVRRVLLLLPKNLVVQWQEELREKRGLVAPRFDGARAPLGRGPRHRGRQDGARMALRPPVRAVRPRRRLPVRRAQRPKRASTGTRAPARWTSQPPTPPSR